MKAKKLLIELAVNQEAQIFGFSENISSEYSNRLRELGFFEGEMVKCVKTPPMGAPRVFEVGGAIFSVESEVAKEIQLCSLKM